MFYLIYLPTKEEFKALLEAQIQPEINLIFGLAVVIVVSLSILK